MSFDMGFNLNETKYTKTMRFGRKNARPEYTLPEDASTMIKSIEFELIRIIQLKEKKPNIEVSIQNSGHTSLKYKGVIYVKHLYKKKKWGYGLTGLWNRCMGIYKEEEIECIAAIKKDKVIDYIPLFLAEKEYIITENGDVFTPYMISIVLVIGKRTERSNYIMGSKDFKNVTNLIKEYLLFFQRKILLEVWK